MRAQIAAGGLIVLTASTDVHEHAKRLIEGLLNQLGVDIVDGGVSAETHEIAHLAETSKCTLIALSTYNGVALTYFKRLHDELVERGLETPVIIGGQLSEIPEKSTDSLPIDVSEELSTAGAFPCRSVQDMMPVLADLAQPGRDISVVNW